MIIQSLQNPKIKHLQQLQNKKYRYTHQEFIAQGFKTCKSLLSANFTLKSIFMTESNYLQHQDDFLINETYLVTDEIMQKISTTITPTGIVGIFAMKQHDFIVTTNSAAFVQIQDPGNLGTLIRSACAMGLEAVYIVDSVDVYSPKVIQATTGTLAHIKFITCSWDILKSHMKSISLCALIVNSDKKPEDIDLKNSILVVGNEGQGLSEHIIGQCATHMTIPMKGHAESLNAAVAGSIAMYLKSQDK
ncbi:RNA methyltransferase [Candidatus Dependentiae bacterium]|nr:RNA methyltransferase [Candidatus Dependentiae bacterium]